MAQQRLAVHRTIVVVDVEGFGDRRRTNTHQVAVRAGLYRVMNKAFGQAGISWRDCRREDRGDGVLVLVPAEVSKDLLAELLLSALAAGLRAHNDTHPGPERIRLRMALHAGEVQFDEHGVTAAAVNLTFRLLNAAELKTALAGSPGVLAVITSSWFYEEVVRHGNAAAGYRQVEVAVKETATTAWICLPDQVDLQGVLVPGLASPAVAMAGMQPAAALRMLPRDTVAFTGRTGELDRLTAAVAETAASGGVFGIYAVSGMAGIGKTTFAVHAAHQLAPRYPDGQIFHRLHAHTAGQRPADPAEALAALLLTIGVAPQRIPPGEQARSALWRELLADKQVLLVLDDAAGTDQVRPLLPGTASCLVLVTSRRQLTALEDVAPVTLDTLPPDQSADLFVRLASRPGLQSSDPEVTEIARLCGYLPLAIWLAAARICHHPAWTVAALATELATARNRLDMQAEGVSVAAAFSLSYEDLTGSQQRLFRRLGLHPSAEIDAYAAAALDGISLPAAKQRLEELNDQNLINEPVLGRYRLHDLLREYARAKAGSDRKANRSAISRLLDYYRHTAMTASQLITWRSVMAWVPSPGDQPAWAPELATEKDAVDWLGTERLNLQACADYAASHGYLAHAAAIPAAISDFLRIQGRWDEALSLGRGGLAAARIAGDKEGEAGILNQLGIALELTGDYPAAEASQSEALQLFSGLRNQRGQACALNQLGLVQWLIGKYPAAEASQSEALRLFRDLDDRRGQAWALNQLGAVHHLTGNYQAAKASQADALAMFDEIGDRRGHAWALHDMGIVQRLTGDHQAAEASQSEAHAIFDEIGDRQGQAWALNQLGVVQCLTGKYPAAAASQSEALEIFDEIGDLRGHAWALHDIGVVQHLTGNHRAAFSTLTQALRLFRDLGDRQGIAEAAISLGDLRSLPPAHHDARRHYTDALDIARDIKAPREEARALEGLGQCHIQEENLDEGAAYLGHALAIYRRLGVPDTQRAERALNGG